MTPEQIQELLMFPVVILTLCVFGFLFFLMLRLCVQIDTRRREQLLKQHEQLIFEERCRDVVPADVVYHYVYNLVRIGYRECDILYRLNEIEERVKAQKPKET